MTREPSHWLKPPGPVAPGLSIGLLGGSFNPPHEGHLHISDMALKRLGLDYVWWLVAPQNPLKSARAAPLDKRIALATKLVDERRVIVTDVERTLGTYYTVDTLEALVRRFPQVRFVWLMGSDNLASFHLWKDWPRIVELMPVAVIMRPGSMLAPLQAKAMQRFWDVRRKHMRGFVGVSPPAFVVVGGRRNALSSTALREGALVGTRAL
ncbi:MAG TPA: nicotinate-nucleotide adenylyltransferase [Rhizomicrobium sp.]|nr:nicotinate-nucleotide adenylyltransferase [Rhizomicrobium sp.]